MAMTKLTMQISSKSRNALSLVAARYNVKPTEIMEFAPLLFHIVASESLKERTERLAELRAARDAICALGGKFHHLAGRLVSDLPAEEIELFEERSIAKRDLRSDSIDNAKSDVETRAYNYEETEDNPFVVHLNDRLSALHLEEGAESMEGWGSYYGPAYAICRGEALAYLGGDEEAANDLIAGYFNLSDIPKDARPADKLAERIAWINAARQELTARTDKFFNTLGIGELL